MKDSLTYTFNTGYFHTGNYVEVPQGSFIYPSSNVIFDKTGRLYSFRGLSLDYSYGGTRAFVLDANVVGFMGTNTTTGKAIGNMIQGVEKSLWFVGNEVSNAVKVYNISTSPPTVIQIGASNAANLTSTPQVARWNGSSWDKAADVGLPAFDDSATPSLSITTPTTRSTGFEGLVKGSRSVRIARKRYDTIGLATASSPVIVASETGDTLVVSVPSYDTTEDQTPTAQNSWILYFTFKGQGSTATHKRFPIEILESQLNGSTAATLHTDGNAKYKVISQHATNQANRLVEVEFNDNELLFDVPQDDTYPLEACKFLAKLGNVMCGIGTGTDSTGFDVSYPNEYEAYPPEWRDWFAEVPVGVAPQEDMGFFWVCSANNTYIAKWTGVTEGAAPVIMEKVSQLYGTIGQGSLLSVFGNLYTLSKGKTPVAISPDGQVNDQFGATVKAAFASYDETTQLIWDEATSSIIFACGTSAIGFNMLTKQWTAPVTLGASSLLAGFSINGHARLCFYSGGTFSTYKWDGGTNPYGDSWNVTGAFQFGKYGRALKDIIQVEAIITNDQSTSDTITFRAYKNFSVSSYSTLATQALTTAGSLLTVREYTEDLDYDTISARIEGTKGGQTIHNATYTVDVHRIERVA